MKHRIDSPSIALMFLLLLLAFFSCTGENPIDTDPGTSTLNDSTILNEPYGSNQRQKYDIYLPANRDNNTPVILMIHGGGWKTGQKEDLNPYVNLIKSKWSSVALVNMNYRLASNANNIHHNEIIADIDAAVNHVKANIARYQISTTMGVMGHSAGGNLAMIYAYKYNNDIKCVGDLAGPCNLFDWDFYSSFNPWVGDSVSAVMTEYVGQPWDSTAYTAVSPYWNVDAGSQPTIIFHGQLDFVVPPYQSQWMRSKLNSLGVTNEYHEYPLASHAFDNEKDDAMNKLVAFFKTHVK